MNVYVDNGYEDRKDYLECLADDLGLDYQFVWEVAEILGESEDFDGLVTNLQDQVG